VEEVLVSIILSIFNEVVLPLSNTDIFISFSIILILIVCSAFISGAEVAYFSLSASELDDLTKENKSSVILKLLKTPNQLLATILIANNFINIAIVVLSSYLTSSFFPEDTLSKFIFQVGVITFLLVLFGEITPKVYANQNAKQFSFNMAKPLLFLQKVFYPLIYLLVSSTNFIDKRLAQRQTEVSFEEITKALDITEHESKEDERRILRSIVEFGNTDVKEVMKSRVDVLAIEHKAKFKEVLQLVISSGFSRIPVYKEQFDAVLGILYIKDLIPFLEENDDFNWLKLCRNPYYVPETKMINDLLKEFQLKKNHIAIVVDEYGGTSGIVTLEDILEEIVGEINDEFDEEENIYSKLDDNNFIFEGKISLNDFLKVVKGEIDYFEEIKGESDSLAGLVLEKEGRILKIGESCSIAPYTFLVESADVRRIKRLKVSIDEK